MFRFSEIKKSFLVALWLMFLTFPIMVIRVNTIYKTIEWRWERMFMVGIGTFFLSFLWRYLIKRKEAGKKKAESEEVGTLPLAQRLIKDKQFSVPAAIGLAVFIVAFPFIFSMYQTNIMTTALIYVVVGLGLNIVVGLAGLLDLGYVAFYAVGAYSYALLNHHFGLGFWAALPIGAIIGLSFRCHAGFSGPSSSGRLPGHRHPGIW